MFDSEPLHTYLHDHLSGANAGLAQARRTARHNAGSELGDAMEAIANQIAQDLGTLEQVADRVGGDRGQIKQLAGDAAEKASQFKLGHAMTRDANLSRLLELEILAIGVFGKRSLWRSLQAAADERLADFDFDHLTQRADEQLQAIEEHRRTAAATALSGGERSS